MSGLNHRGERSCAAWPPLVEADDDGYREERPGDCVHESVADQRAQQSDDADDGNDQWPAKNLAQVAPGAHALSFAVTSAGSNSASAFASRAMTSSGCFRRRHHNTSPLHNTTMAMMSSTAQMICSGMPP